MKKIVIVADSNADVSEKYKSKIKYISQYFKFESEDIYHEDMDRTLFYEKLKQEKVVTSAPNPDLIYETFKSLIKDGNDIICISFSSKMSSTYNLFKIAAEDVIEELSEYNPKIEVIDSLCAGPGQGMICADAVDMVESGKSFEEIVSVVKNNLDKYKVYFIVNDFKYLVQGGRVSQTTANLGKVLNIKPILSIKEGSIQSIAKPRGLNNAFETIKNYIGSEYEKIWFIQASDMEVMSDFKKYITKELNDNDIESIPLNLITCSHLGPDAAALIVKK